MELEASARGPSGFGGVVEGRGRGVVKWLCGSSEICGVMYGGLNQVQFPGKGRVKSVLEWQPSVS